MKAITARETRAVIMPAVPSENCASALGFGFGLTANYHVSLRVVFLKMDSQSRIFFRNDKVVYRHC